MEEITNSMNTMDISTVESTVIVPKVVKKRIFKKKEVSTVEPDIESNISSGNTVVLLPTQNDTDQPLVAVSSEDNDVCSSVGDQSVVSSKEKKVAKKRTKKTEVVVAVEQTIDTTKPIKEKAVKKAPKKTKKGEESQPTVDVTKSENEPVAPIVVEVPVVKKAPKKTKKGEENQSVVDSTELVNEQVVPVVKKAPKKTKKGEENQPTVDPTQPDNEQVLVAIETPKEKAVGKTTKKTTKKGEESQVSKEEGETTQHSHEEESFKSKKKITNKNEDKIKMSEIKPKSVPQFFAILATYIRQNTHYVGLRENTDGLIVPVFFVITGIYNKEAKKFPCQFFKESVTTDEEGIITVKPLWEEVWQTGFITQSQCLNMLPFDETQDYFYTPKTVEEQKICLYNM